MLRTIFENEYTFAGTLILILVIGVAVNLGLSGLKPFGEGYD